MNVRVGDHAATQATRLDGCAAFGDTLDDECLRQPAVLASDAGISVFHVGERPLRVYSVEKLLEGNFQLNLGVLQPINRPAIVACRPF